MIDPTTDSLGEVEGWLVTKHGWDVMRDILHSELQNAKLSDEERMLVYERIARHYARNLLACSGLNAIDHKF